jgi:hypothetical protein
MQPFIIDFAINALSPQSRPLTISVATSRAELRPMERGPLQVLPWTHWTHALDTSCCGCHVGPIRSTYDLTTDTYSTDWKWPRIKSDTSHYYPDDRHLGENVAGMGYLISPCVRGEKLGCMDRCSRKPGSAT